MILALASLGFVGYLALGPGPDLLDLPYPETAAGSGSAGSAQSQVAATLAAYARKLHGGAGKHEVRELRIEGLRASAILATAGRTERVELVYGNEGWRIVPPTAPN